ncbi:IS1 family transposase [Pseudomonas sp. FME51]|nr:IS1 family transposase [Pseudomonas sp. FME51]
MKIIKEINVNVCKTEGCEHFSEVVEDAYVIPSFKLGFPAVYCSRCGGSSVLINNEDIKILLNPYVDFFKLNINEQCPHCDSLEKVLYGKTAKGTTRYQCKCCNTVFSLKNSIDSKNLFNKIMTLFILEAQIPTYIIKTLGITPALFYRKLSTIEKLIEIKIRKYEQYLEKSRSYDLQTNVFTLNCRNNATKGFSNELFGMITCCSKTGYVFLPSVNWSEILVSSDSQYHNNTKKEILDNTQGVLLDNIIMRYEQINSRKSFGQIQYTDKTCSEHIIEPVVLSHFHFLKLKFILPVNIQHHFIYHDSFIRGGCMVAYGKEIKKKHSHLYYVVSNGSRLTSEFNYKGSYTLGWWNNKWYEFISPDKKELFYLCNLGLNKNNDIHFYTAIMPSLDYSQLFIQSFKDKFPESFLKRLSPNTVKLLLSIYSFYYNYCLTQDGKVPAQKIGLLKEKITIKDFFI